jgi:hypothetical protein
MNDTPFRVLLPPVFSEYTKLFLFFFRLIGVSLTRMSVGRDRFDLSTKGKLMAKSISTQCKCGVWFPISQGKVLGATLFCQRCHAMALHPAGKKLEKVS